METTFSTDASSFVIPIISGWPCFLRKGGSMMEGSVEGSLVRRCWLRACCWFLATVGEESFLARPRTKLDRYDRNFPRQGSSFPAGFSVKTLSRVAGTESWLDFGRDFRGDSGNLVFSDEDFHGDRWQTAELFLRGEAGFQTRIYKKLWLISILLSSNLFRVNFTHTCVNFV